jgi:hypothetical protein
MHFFIQKPQLEKEKALMKCDIIHKTLSETINHTQYENEYVKEFVANELNADIYYLMSYYDETKDCEIGQKLKNYIKTLINMTNDDTKKSKWKEKIKIIEQNCN